MSKGISAAPDMHSRSSNVLAMVAGQVLGKGSLVASLMLVSRYLADTQFGMLFFAVALGQILLFLADLGVSLISNREFSLHPERIQKLYSTALGLRVLTTIASWSLLMLGSLAAGYGSQQLLMILLVGTGWAMEAGAELQFAVFRSRERMVYEAICRIAGGLTLLGLVLLVIRFDLGATFTAGMYAVRATVVLILSLLFLRKFGIRIIPGFSRAHMLRLLKESWPLGLMGFFFIAFQRADNIIIRTVCGVEAVGAWQEPIRILESLSLLISPSLLPGALFPGLCRSFREGGQAVARRMTDIGALVTGLAIAVMLPLAAGGMQVLRTLWGSSFLRDLPRDEVHLTLLVLTAALPVLFWMHFMIASMIAAGKQRLTVPVMAGALGLSVSCNLFLVPRMGIAGSAWTVLIVNLLMAGAFWIILARTWPLPMWRGLWKPVLAAAPAAVLMQFTGSWSMAARMTAVFGAYLIVWIPMGGLSMLWERDESGAAPLIGGPTD